MITILIPLYRGVTHLDFTGPHQFLSTIPDAHVIVASLDGAPIVSHGLTFANLTDLETIEHCDVLCVPGGLGCIPAMENERFLQAIRRLAGRANYITSVCTGSLILGAAGVLKGRRAACHWAWREMLTSFEAIPEDGRVVRDGHIITGGGVTAGIDFALILIAELWGDEAAQSVQLLLEYAPSPPSDAGLPETAPSRVREAVLNRMADALEDAHRRVDIVARATLHRFLEAPG
ncbi:putative intracellular protease/amidase [Acetobacter nitrogenifigens DSM 23921 = NBRC 105050]|uniref:AraC family transcriptional regulator n=1 Tax=Acetobacter nitrogenifigens DSM 23921 = NBRC 105050 TaxID=1120919 RepID=A0A511XET9_9PROT|nr:DJ-1/PfpI family protein [Acetobacter nitrogenifigens]GBQ99662.1 putative intracellular protease/amidase [Acetobacter nitrogenifigens DSM 23921 = NBRC 105050]GEN61470.1 AraC family transcriptional regulator [Acetobacter nitrogenifigens DSM 23921 = NBRC 105050]